jgi:hypothetical protein
LVVAVDVALVQFAPGEDLAEFSPTALNSALG